jgi:dual specificity tyrosine-phosphorylation-regulated kinase 2/3/4
LGKRRKRTANGVFLDDEDGFLMVCAGDQLGYRYTVVGGLGSGAFAHVVKAYDHKEREMVAIKIIKNRPKYTQQSLI